MAGADTPAADQGPAEPAVRLEVSQVAELPVPDEGHEARMYALVTVTVRRPPPRTPRTGPGPAHAPHHAVVFLIDHSSSMVHPPTRMAAAWDAAAAAVHAVPDGTYFAVVAGSERPTLVYPAPQPGTPGAPVAADDATRRAAEDALRAGSPGGGTAIGGWLTRARELFRQLPGNGEGFVCHVLLLTDGRNEPAYESGDRLTEQVEACADEFTCDAVGIGDDWRSHELLLITGTLHGVAYAVEDLDGLTERLRDLTREAADRHLAGLRVRLYRSERAELRSFGQVHPTRRELTPVPAPDPTPTPYVTEFATQPWGDETRSYLLSLTALHAGDEVGSEVMLAEVELVRADGDRIPVTLPPSVPVLVRWSGDHGLYSRMHPDVGHYLHQEELVRVFEEGCAALRVPDAGTACRAFGRAWQLAVDVGDEAMQKHLRKLIEPGEDGSVRLLSRIRPFDIESARIRVSHTVTPR
ncbi:vWA domain-containing protein [Streptomyces sp. NBC_01766]|uniref:vWA domain-containing protein n=1 Tax=Streptomyces sp. NBC_01766 TaxID=2975936 RepID=UPI002DDB7029|nr:vWA domain-containing protein [Streptomyces sp. NBC_01766]WSC19999.1 VWA domain-containing protein [Streptomyces sp. NBC_01766]